MTDQPNDKPQEKAPKVRPMTKLDRELERKRKAHDKKMYEELHAFTTKLMEDKLANLRRIPDAEWKKAQEADEDNE